MTLGITGEPLPETTRQNSMGAVTSHKSKRGNGETVSVLGILLEPREEIPENGKERMGNSIALGRKH